MSEKRDLSRAEIARQRRAQRVTNELHQTRQRASRAAVPAVTSRRSNVSVAPKQRRSSNRRRFNIAFGLLPETHLHKRGGLAIPSLRGDWRQLSGLVAILVCALLYFILTLPFFHVAGAAVQGNIRLSAEEVNAVLGVTGQSIFTVQPEELKNRLLLNYHELASVQVTASLPNHVTVTVSEREPVILWQQDGGYTWIDSAGVAFRPHGTVNGLVLVNGLGAPAVNPDPMADPLSPQPFIQKELVDAILVLAPTVPADTAMIFDPSYGLGWKDSRGWNVFFGTSMDDMPMKALVYQALVNDLVARGKTPEFISVAYPDAPFYRMGEDYSSQTTNDGQ
jgi:hypothetical protein